MNIFPLLHLARLQATLSEFEARAEQAAALGVEPFEIEACHELFGRRTEGTSAALARDAEAASVADFRGSR